MDTIRQITRFCVGNFVIDFLVINDLSLAFIGKLYLFWFNIIFVVNKKFGMQFVYFLHFHNLFKYWYWSRNCQFYEQFYDKTVVRFVWMEYNNLETVVFRDFGGSKHRVARWCGHCIGSAWRSRGSRYLKWLIPLVSNDLQNANIQMKIDY